MDQQTFYLLFVPGLAVAALGIGVLFSVLAYTQGALQPETKAGLISLTVVVLLAVALGVLAFKIDHPPLLTHTG
ncbi:MAG: hypothetical protein M3Z98_11395 [Candidatus Dormibacteraeota bacterium]|nr:hypothetical protein [Candidatus Dormibacteraeota bacterium]